MGNHKSHYYNFITWLIYRDQKFTLKHEDEYFIGTSITIETCIELFKAKREITYPKPEVQS